MPFPSMTPVMVLQDWSNPLVSKHIQRYPVLPKNGVVSEIWHADKWRHDLDRHLLSPMYNSGGGRHYFIDEPARLTDGRVVIPIRWLEDESGLVWFDAWEVIKDEQTGDSTICDDTTELLSSSLLTKNFLDLEGSLPKWSAETIRKGHVSRIPNPDRALAEGHPIYSSFVDIFGDDVSGNRSKSWNKHLNIYITHRNLPRKLLYQQSNVHFVSTSTHASVPEQFHGIKEIIEKTHQEPIRTHSVVDGCETLIKLQCNCAPGDNPSQSETCGHIGNQGNYPCRKCMVGGSQKEKETKEGFQQFFSAGQPRSSKETLAEVKKQVEVACLGTASSVTALQTSSGIKDAFTQHWIDKLIERSREMHRREPRRPIIEIQAELMKWVEENKSAVFNPFLTLDGFDVALDTPVEILHTILLGVVKYAWYGSHSVWNDSQKRIYSNRLQGTDVHGLSVAAIRANYIMQYSNSLIGRQLKTLAQVNTFHVHDLVDSPQFLLTKAVGELSVLLWMTEIRSMEEYLSDIETAAANVLDTAALIDPSKIVLKIKYHLLVHLRQDILRFGPLLGVATETYEAFNAIFRFCSIFSNHLAPSRDIALQLAEQEILRHVLSGGYWKDKNGNFKQGGASVIGFLPKNTFLQNLLGYGRSEANVQVPGTIRLEPVKHLGTKKLPRETLSLKETSFTHAVNVPHEMQDDRTKWHHGKYVISQAQDECQPGSWVYANSPFSHSEAPITGRIVEILQNVEGLQSIILLDQFQVRRTRHDLFGVPVLIRRLNKTMLTIVRSEDIMFEYNVQHDCQNAKCTASGSRAVVQERRQSGLTESFIEHKAVDRFLINTHSFHNAHLIRAVLPRELTAPIPYSLTREEDHFKLADQLFATQEMKRHQMAEKRKATEVAKKGQGLAQGSRKRKRGLGNDEADGMVD